MSTHSTTSNSLDVPSADAAAVDRICAEAQKDAFFYDSINDACPYPFTTWEGIEYRRAFIAARQVMNYGSAT